MNDKDLIEFFIYLRDHCYNRDFSIEPKKVVECFYEYRNAGYKLPIHDVSSQVCQCMMPQVDSRDTFSTCHRCHLPARR